MLILTFEDSEEEILNHIISCVNTGARAFQVIENAKTNLSYGDIVILLDKRELFRKQEKIDLSFIEFEILHLLMRSPGRVFSKEQIYDIIWNEPYSGDYNVVMRHICNIREKKTNVSEVSVTFFFYHHTAKDYSIFNSMFPVNSSHSMPT